MYFQKPMKVKLVTMKNSAMAQQTKMSILSNEVVRRLSKVNYHRIGREEVVEVMYNFTSELRNSDYDHKESMDIVSSGMIGWKRKLRRREKEKNGMYRCAGSTLRHRYKKKLLERENWYSKRKRVEEEEDGGGERDSG